MSKPNVSFVLDPKIIDFIEDIHKGLGVTKSQFVEECITYYINNCISEEIKEKVNKIRAIRESMQKEKQK